MFRLLSPRLLARWTVVGLPLVGVAVALAPAARGSRTPVVNAQKDFGTARTINMNGPVVDDDNPFFADLGVNGRRCVTCHSPEQNMTVTPAALQARFDATGGTDPIFRPNDGSNSPLADVSTPAARREAYSMLQTRASSA